MRKALTLSLLLLTTQAQALTKNEHMVCVLQAERIQQNADSHSLLAHQVIEGIQLNVFTAQEYRQVRQTLKDKASHIHRQVALFKASNCMTEVQFFSSQDRLENCRGMRSSYCE